ncbi:hypothetical protein ACXPWS_16480 [Mycobacterium sp. BMJ-28]
MNAEQAARFYAARDGRTRQYGAQEHALDTHVLLTALQISSTRCGQLALLAAVNMVARTHRTISVDLTPAPLKSAALIAADTIEQAVIGTVLAINPAAVLIVNGVRRDTNDLTPVHPEPVVGLGLGPVVSRRCHMWVGWSGGRAHLSTQPTVCGSSDTDILGAATAACVGVAALFHLTHGRRMTPMVLNLVDRASAAVAEPGSIDPDHPVLGVTTNTVGGVIDVGDVHLIGAGAVSHGLAYWVRELGSNGTWTVIDGDHADLTNTNRCVCMTAAQAGWPAGLPTAAPVAKADALAASLTGGSEPLWFDQWAATNPPRADLTLVLANERGVRAHAAALGEPILLHATTSASWTAELHRHLARADDCPACRIPDLDTPAFACSSGPTGTASTSADAALPFLSAAAGLMLAIALQQISPDHPLTTGRHNHWRLCFEETLQLRGSIHANRCPHTLPAAARAQLHSGQPRRHDHHDHLEITGG